jgi:DNA-directed RNA polymerase specialized sigma24 family protein
VSTRPGSSNPQGYETWLRGPSGRSMLWSAFFFAGDPEVAEEIARKAAAKVLKSWSDDEMRHQILNRPDHVLAIVRDCFADHIRADQFRKREVAPAPERHSWTAGGPDQDLRSAVRSLDDSEDGEEDMIILGYYVDLANKEASIRLDLSKSQADRLHNKALAHLGRLLGEKED